jgi:outer membrane protein OmpA-like peptidoglycan-associated protein
MGHPVTGNRVTVYYLLAEHFGKLGLFAGAAAAIPAAAVAVALPFAAIPAAQHGRQRRADAAIPTALIGCGAIGLVIIATSAIAMFVAHRPAWTGAPPVAAPDNVVATPAPPAAPAIPQGSAAIASEVNGKPEVSVYFDSAKADVSADFATAAAPVKAWVASHAGTHLQVSGFNDPTGNAAFNAELAKHRAQNVAAALVAQGIAADAIDLVKPAAATDTGTTKAEARRVDITVADTAAH